MKGMSAQSLVEYAIIIAVTAGALIGMSIYLKRGFQGRLRQAGDEMGEQYSPVKTVSDITIETNTNQQINQNLVPLMNESAVPPTPILDEYTNQSIYGIETEVSINETQKKVSGSYERVGTFETSLF